MITLGIPGSGFIMGFVVQHLGVSWIYWIFAIINAVQFVAYVLFGEETLYVKDSPVSQEPRAGFAKFVPRRIDPRPIRFRSFFEPLFLARFPRILIPGVAYGVEFAYANIAIIVCTPLVFGEKFHFNAQQIGYQFVSVIIGSVIGEQLSGPMSDWFLKYRHRQKGHTIPADRLWLSYIGFGTVFAGLLVWGFQLEKAVTWNVTPCIGMAVAAFGNQVLTTILISFAVDSHKEHAPSIGVFINFCRQIYGFVSPSRDRLLDHNLTGFSLVRPVLFCSHVFHSQAHRFSWSHVWNYCCGIFYPSGCDSGYRFAETDETLDS